MPTTTISTAIANKIMPIKRVMITRFVSLRAGLIFRGSSAKLASQKWRSQWLVKKLATSAQ